MQESFEPDVDVAEPVQDELEVLKARADRLGISYHPSIKVEKLREKLEKEMSGEVPEKASPTKVVKEEETEAQLNNRKRLEATELIRIRVTCMNPQKKDWDGEIFTTGNAIVGTIKKYVPFNADEGWHVPRMIYQQMLERQCQVFYTVTNRNGVKTRAGKLIREFNIEVLPPLTVAELKEIAQRQAMAAGSAA